MWKEITLYEANNLASNGEWPVLRKAVDNRMNDAEYASGRKSTVMWELSDSNGDIVGVMGYEIMPSGKVYVGPLEVHKAHRGNGYGSLMLATLKAGVMLSGTPLFLYSHIDTIQFYEKNGFVKGEMVEEDCYEMSWKYRDLKVTVN